jgi:hypothetical protein
LAISQGISFMDAAELLDSARELRELEADDGTSHADWLDSTERPTPPRPYGVGADEDWARDQRRAAAAGVEIDHASWQAGAELGVDAVGQMADAQRADRIAALKQRTAGALDAAKQREDQRRVSTLDAELISRARQRTQDAQREAARPTPHSSYYQA